MKFKPLLDRWKKMPRNPTLSAEEYAIRLPLDDAARLHALVELFPGRSDGRDHHRSVRHAGLDEIAAAMPYESGSQGDLA